MPNENNAPGEISTRLVSFSADSPYPPGINNYDSFAEGYTASNETSFVNTYYERPAMLALAGEVAGRRILDAGCGSGPLFEALRDRELQPGDPVPSARDITREWGVALATATKVLATLNAEGLTRALPGRGTLVAAGPHPSSRRVPRPGTRATQT